MAQDIEICSFLMGSHKTNKIIEWMKSNPNEKYIYVIPNLSELEDTEDTPSRVLSIGFETPEVDKENKTKSESLYSKLVLGANIACTHALYKMLSKKHLELIRQQNYIIVADEEVSLINVYEQASSADLVSLLNDNKVEISEEDGLVKWIADDIVSEPYKDTKHKHHRFYVHITNENIYTTRCTKKNGVYDNAFMVSQITKELVSCAKRLIIITYLFKGSVLDAFLRLKGFNTVKFEDIGIVEAPLQDVVSRIKLLPYDNKLSKCKLSSSWWKGADASDIKTINNYIRRVSEKEGFESNLVMWTCPSDRVKGAGKSKVKNFINPVGYTKDKVGETLWLGCSVRATNKYSHKKLAIHCFDRYPHVAIESYLLDYGIKIDKEVFAITELLQWCFRGNIRVDGGTMTLAIASKRMYDLYLKWTKGGFKDEF